MTKKNYETIKEGSVLVPFIAIEHFTVIPGIPQPVKIEDEEQRKVLDNCYRNQTKILILSSDTKQEDAGPANESDFKKIGMICKVDKLLQMPGAPSLVFVTPLHRAKFIKVVYSPVAELANIEILKDITIPKRLSKETPFLIERAEEISKDLINYIPEPEKFNAQNIIAESSVNPLSHLYAMAYIAPAPWEEKYKILECDTFHKLILSLVNLLDQAQQRIKIQAAIHEKTHHEISQQQKEAFLRMSLKQIHDELGESEENEDIPPLLRKAESKKWSKKAKEHFDKEVKKLRRLNINNPEYSVQFSYLDTLLELPWENYNVKKIDLKKVEDTLNRDHYGLENVKERILEYMSVLKLRNDLKAPIICLYGPPGVGKTSIGKSIAEAAGREYSRISLGGMHDEAEIRGHRRTYIGAMPGRFLQALSKLKYGNPLILLDEIDKVGKDYKGDPSSALLEALDPEQNNTFHDNFIDFPYDLSKVLFIATANDISTIPAPLRDRMELIEIPGYIPAEKTQIAQHHLLNKVLKDNGFNEDEISFTDEAVDFIVKYYTREAGVRQLEKKISKIIRKIAFLKASGKSYPSLVTPIMAEDFLGKKEILPETYENNDYAGIATGLAWTPVGGDILFIETSLSEGKGEKITLTGNLGDVMKESAVIAVQYLKANAGKLGIDSKIFEKYDIHIHVPEGAVPKDGPSAGITLATALLSALTGRRMKEKTAMTGEITLRGKVLPVGGIKEKIIAARQAGIKRIILSGENRRNIEEIKPEYIEGLEFIYVKNISEVFENALSDEMAPFRFELSNPN